MNNQKTDALARPSPETVQVADVQNVRTLAKDLLDSGLFPGVKNVAGAVTVIQAGLELGIPPVAALNTMAIISGRLTLEAKALLAIAQNRAGVSWRVVKEDENECEIIFSRPGWPDAPSTFTAKEAETAGLLKKQNWLIYRKDMLFARAASRGIRRIAPDAVLGLYSKEEMTDAAPLDTATPKVAPAVVHAPKNVQDEWTSANAVAMPPEVAEATMEPDPLDDAHHEPVKDVRFPGGCTLEDLNSMAKAIADLKVLGVDEALVYSGINKQLHNAGLHEIAEPSELDHEAAVRVIGYLHRWRGAVERDKAKQEGAK